MFDFLFLLMVEGRIPTSRRELMRVLRRRHLRRILRRVNARHFGIWNPRLEALHWQRLCLANFPVLGVKLRVSRHGVQGRITNLLHVCVLRDDEPGVPTPYGDGLSLWRMPFRDGDEIALVRDACLRLSGQVLVEGQWDAHYQDFHFTVSMDAIEAIVEALASAPGEDDMLWA